MNNFTSYQIKAEDIQIGIPFSIAGSIGVLIVIFFIIAQIIENKNSKKFRNKMGQQLVSLNKDNTDIKERKSSSLFQQLLFDHKEYKGKALAYMLS